MSETTELVLNKSTPDSVRWFALLDLELEAQFEGEVENIVECLIKVLKEDANPIVRHDAAYLLGKLQSLKAINALCEAATTDKSPLVRHEATEILAFLPYTNETKSALQKSLNDPIREVRETAQIVVEHLEKKSSNEHKV